MKFSNIYQFIKTQAEKYSGRPIYYVRRQGLWQSTNWESFFEAAIEFACALKTQGLGLNRSVCVFMDNRPEWAIADVGTILARGVSVGLYPTSSAEQCQYIIAHAESEFILVDTAERLGKILRILDHLPSIKRVIVAGESTNDADQRIIGFDRFLQIGRESRANLEDSVREAAQKVSADEIAMMVYTSGTTGHPKGACLSHQYVINSAESVVETLSLQDTDTGFSYLPFCHVAERIAGFYTRLCAGITAYFVDDLSKLYTYMLEVKPTIFASLPRFFEKIHAKLMMEVERMSEAQRERFEAALTLGRQVNRAGQIEPVLDGNLLKAYAEALSSLLPLVQKYTGGNIRMMTSGGAPLPLEIGEFFDAAGIPILEAYGLTENVCVAFNRPNRHRFGTVGLPMVGCEIKIADDGEILVRSQMMFSGYFKEPEKTAEMFRDGWLLTGDLGQIDEDGFLKIIGRKKELIITSTGKNIAPLMLENRVKEHPLISHAMIYGDGKSYLVALVTLNQSEVEEVARTRAFAYSNFDELTRHPEVQQLVQQLIDRINATLSSTEAIKKFFILNHDLSVEAGEITPTMKLKRATIAAHYKELFENLYL
jgi:long-chain acyl-CoA synthetase